MEEHPSAYFKWSYNIVGKTHHQESKEDDTTAPHVCSPAIIFLSLIKKNDKFLPNFKYNEWCKNI